MVKERRKKNLFHSDNMQAASTLAPEKIKNLYPEINFTVTSIYTTITLKDLIPVRVNCNFLNIDIQGAEFEAIKGLGDLIDQIDYIYTEVYSMELYRDNGLIKDVDRYLRKRGIIRVGADLNPKIGWGDALYVCIDKMSIMRKIDLKFGTLRFYFDLRLKHANRRIRNLIRKLLLLDR